MKGGDIILFGDIVHNSREVERLKAMGLITINHEGVQTCATLILLRAKVEITAKRNNIEIIDATCPVVLLLGDIIYANNKAEGKRRIGQRRNIILFGRHCTP